MRERAATFLFAAIPLLVFAHSLPAAAQLADVDSLWDAGNRALSLHVTDSLLARPQDPEVELDLLLRAASRYASVGEPRRAEAKARSALDRATARGDSARALAALRWLSVAVGLAGRADEARQLYQRLHDRSLASGDRRHEAWALVGLGWDALGTGESLLAATHYARASELFAALEDREGEAWALNGLGVAEQRLARYEEAKLSFERAAVRAREARFQMVEAMALNNLATLEFMLGDPGIAGPYFATAEDLQRAGGHVREALMPALNVAICHLELGRYREAEVGLHDLLVECRERGFTDVEGDVLYMLADLERRRGRRHLAARTFNEALALEPGIRLRTQVECRLGRAEVLAELDSTASALAINAEAKQLVAGRALGEINARVALQRADLLTALGRYEAAQAELAPHLGAGAVPTSSPLQVEVLVVAAAAARGAGRPDEAMARLDEAARRWYAERGVPLDPEWRESRGRAGRRLYSLLAALYLDDIEQLAENDPEMAERRTAELFDRLQSFKARTLQERMAGPGRAAATDREAMPLATLEDLRSTALRPGELFLDFYLGTECSLVLAVSRDDARAMRLEGADLESRGHRFLELVSAPPEPGAGDEAALRASAHHLLGVLCDGVRDLLDRHRTVIVAPDGVVTMLPFAYMDSASGDSGSGSSPRTWLRIPSASTWLHLRGHEVVPASRVLAIAGRQAANGVELPGVDIELAALRSYRGVTVAGGVGPAIDDSLLSGADVLHFASHLKLDDQRPWQSGLLLGSAGEPTVLRAGEISAMELGARLVVLSSCASAGGRVLSGEGVLGISSAFLSAGASSIVATLWPVDDRVTADFMACLYAHLARGEPVAAALGHAQRALERRPETSHPFYWAGFIVTGDPDVEVSLEPRGPGRDRLLLVVLLLTAALFAASRRSRPVSL